MAQADTTEGRLTIQTSQLDAELEVQPLYFYDAVVEFVEAGQALEQARDERQAAEAQARIDLREIAQRTGEKTTETSVADRASVTPQVVNAERKFKEVKARYELALGTKQAFEQRSFILKDLVALQVSGYHMETGRAPAEPPATTRKPRRQLYPTSRKERI